MLDKVLVLSSIETQTPYGRTCDEPFPICMKVQTFHQRLSKIRLKEGELKTTQILDQVAQIEYRMIGIKESNQKLRKGLTSRALYLGLYRTQKRNIRTFSIVI